MNRQTATWQGKRRDREMIRNEKQRYIRTKERQQQKKKHERNKVTTKETNECKTLMFGLVEERNNERRKETNNEDGVMH